MAFLHFLHPFRMMRTPQFRRAARRLCRWGGGLALLAVVLLAVAWWRFPFPVVKLGEFPAAILLTDREGTPLRLKLGPDDTDCRLLYKPEPSDWICQAIVAAEDRRFWRHAGVDPLALARACLQNLTCGRRISGASTLSTQVVRLMQPRPRNLATKGIEGFRALQLEQLLGKNEILEQYLNRAPFGGNLVGIDAASRRFFGKAPADLSLAEAALLAGLPQSPTRFRPDRHLERARQRQAYVLGRMLEEGMITVAQHDLATAQPILIRPEAYPFRAPHFSELVLRFPAPPGTRTLRPTTLDPGLQARLEAAMRQRAPELARRAVFGGAVVILEVRTGAVRALVGSPDYFDRPHQGQVNAAMARRSPGSALKPFVYALAMDQGRLTPERVLADVPVRYGGFRPENFDRQWRGLVTAREALVQSLNIPALALAQECGPELFHDRLRQLGLRSLGRATDRYGLGIVLGGGEVRLLELANAYACLARGGRWLPWRVDEPLPNGVPAPGRALFSAEAAWLVSDMLAGEERAVQATGHRADTRLPRFAWKTGTSAGFRDAWTVAWNPEYVIAAWFGNPGGQGVDGLTGGDVAAPFVWDVARALYPTGDGPWFARPTAIQTHPICAASGLPPGPDCQDTCEGWFIAGVTLREPCPVHRRVAGVVQEEWPPAVRDFLRHQRAAIADSAAVTAAVPPPRILSPANAAVFRALPGVAASHLSLSASSAAGGELHWFVDERPVGSCPAGGVVPWRLVPGRHVLLCVDQRGQHARAEITVEP